MNLLYANDRVGQYPPSFYAATAEALAPFPALKGAVKADVCIIGGGYTGLSAAWHLAQAGRRVVLLEAHKVGFGASGRNGGQVGSGQRLDQADLERMAGDGPARMLWQIAEEAKALVKQVADVAPGVHWKPGIAHACTSEAEVRHAHQTADYLATRYGYSQIEKLDREALRAILPSAAYVGGDLDHGGAHVHPLNLALGLARLAAQAGAVIHEGSPVHHVQKGTKVVVQTDRGRVEADHLILAGNGYIGGLEPQVAARVMPINNYIIATEPLRDRAREVLTRDVAVADSKFVVNYWRLSHDNRLIFGGGESYGYRFPRDIAALARKPMLGIYPALADVKIDYAWGGTLAITVKRMPYFARVTGNIFSASGYSGHGVALATMAGRMLAEATLGTSEKFDAMAALPAPRFPGGAYLRWPILVSAMSWFALRDRLGL